MAFDYPVILSKRGERFLASFEEGNPLPPRSLLDELCLREGEEAVMLTLTLPREENWSWLG